MKMFQARYSAPRDSIIGSWLITTVIVIILATVKTHAISDAIFECCPENSVPICSTKNCADGSRVRLYCPNDGSFHRLNPEAYDFDTSQDDLKFIYRNVSIPATKFCVSGKHEKDRWAFVCSNDENEDDSIAKFAVLGIQNIMSAVFLFLIWAIYLILPDLRNIQDKAVARIVAFLACGCMLLAMTQLRIYDDCLCIPVALLLYWIFLSAFFWMSLVSFNVWRSAWFTKFPIKDEALFLIFRGTGFVGPGLLLIVPSVAHYIEGFHLKPRFSENSCWFGGYFESWAIIYGPIACLLALNVLFFGLTFWRLWYRYRGYNSNALISLRFNCLLYFKLFLIMGMTWISNIISFFISNSKINLLWFFFEVYNSMQGWMIFILLVFLRKRVKKLLAERKPYVINFPKYWSAYNVEEVASPSAFDIELSNAP